MIGAMLIMDEPGHHRASLGTPDGTATHCPCGAVHVVEGEHPECARCETYRCARCERWRPWDDGCADDTPTLCDDCWGAVEMRPDPSEAA